MNRDMTKGSPMKTIVGFTIPIFIGNVFQQFYSMVDTVVVGQFVGTGALAAVGSTGTIMFLILGFLLGFSTGVTVLTGQRFGAGDMESMRKTVASSVVLSAIVLVALLLSIVPLLELMPGLLTHGDSVEVREFLERALDIVIGIEFIKMLAKHSPGSVLEVLLYAIARHMIVGHEDAVQNLVSVGAIALIFIIRKFFFVPSFGHKMPGGDLAPDIKEKEKEEE